MRRTLLRDILDDPRVQARIRKAPSPKPRKIIDQASRRERHMDLAEAFDAKGEAVKDLYPRKIK